MHAQVQSSSFGGTACPELAVPRGISCGLMQVTLYFSMKVDGLEALCIFQ